jgi:hypothetical protein
VEGTAGTAGESSGSAARGIDGTVGAEPKLLLRRATRSSRPKSLSRRCSRASRSSRKRAKPPNGTTTKRGTPISAAPPVSLRSELGGLVPVRRLCPLSIHSNDRLSCRRLPSRSCCCGERPGRLAPKVCRDEGTAGTAGESSGSAARGIDGTVGAEPKTSSSTPGCAVDPPCGAPAALAGCARCPFHDYTQSSQIHSNDHGRCRAKNVLIDARL